MFLSQRLLQDNTINIHLGNGAFRLTVFSFVTISAWTGPMPYRARAVIWNHKNTLVRAIT